MHGQAFLMSRTQPGLGATPPPSGSLLRNYQSARYPLLFSWVAVSIVYYPPGVLHELLQAQGIDQTFLDQALGGEHGGGAVWTSA